MRMLRISQGCVFRALFVVALGSVILTSTMSWVTCRGIGSTLAPDLTREGLLKLRIGMTEREIAALIGDPLDKEPPANHLYDKSWGWIYAKPGIFETGLELGLAVQDGRLVRAAGEIHDLTVYYCSEEACPLVPKLEGLSCLPEHSQ